VNYVALPNLGARDRSSLAHTLLSVSVFMGLMAKMTHSVNTVKTGILGVGRDTSVVLGVSLKRPRTPGPLW
jgi:hypothetical protein